MDKKSVRQSLENQAKQFLDSVGITLEDYLPYMDSGNHALNPYHNPSHCLSHSISALSCLFNEGTKFTSEDCMNLVVASLFHDHNHSGGKYSDKENIEEAIGFLNTLDRSMSMGCILFDKGFDKAIVTSLIEVTEFTNRKFVKEPTTLLERCMRDADLMSIYSDEGRFLLLGLFEEVTGQSLLTTTTTKRNDFLDNQAQFLRQTVTFTKHGGRMKDLYLDKSLKAFSSLMKANLI